MKILERDATYIVKGTSITFKEKIRVNEETGEEIYDPKLEQENDVKLYNEYRKLNSLLLPEEIKSIREKYGVTQIEFAQILGLGDKTITRYENGSLQDTAQNNLIKIVGRNPEEFLKLLKECKKISKEKINELSEKISVKINNSKPTYIIHISNIEDSIDYYPSKEKVRYDTFNKNSLITINYN